MKRKTKRKRKPQYTKVEGLWVERLHNRYFIKPKKDTNKVFETYPLYSIKQARRYIKEFMKGGAA